MDKRDPSTTEGHHLSGHFEVRSYTPEHGFSMQMMEQCDICYALVTVGGYKHYEAAHGSRNEIQKLRTVIERATAATSWEASHIILTGEV